MKKKQSSVLTSAICRQLHRLLIQKRKHDPSADNFKPYRDPAYDAAKTGILGRYKDINNPHGNSPVSNNSSQFVNAFTQYPDAEELNRDNTLNEVEEYFQYKVDIKPNMLAGTNFITDKRTVNVKLADGTLHVMKHGTCSVFLFQSLKAKWEIFLISNPSGLFGCS